MALLVGVTGGMGSGKSTVSGIMSREGGHVIDADQICRDLVEPGQPAWKEVLELFGPDIIYPDQSLDRSKIAGIIFKDSLKKAQLEEILHPRVFEEEQREFEALSRKNPESVVILDAALLIESENYRKVNKVVVVSCAEELQIERIVAQGRFQKDDAIRRIRLQMPLEEKKSKADYIVENNSTKENLDRQVVALFNKLKALT